MDARFDVITAGWHRSERGASAVEYGLLISGVAAVIVAAIFLFGGAVTDLFTETCETIRAEAGGQTCVEQPAPDVP